MTELPESLRPTATEIFELRSGDRVEVAKATPRFTRWSGDPPPSDYGGKPIVDYQGRPAFAELAILWSLQDDGWDGAWVTHRAGGVVYRDNLMHYAPRSALAESLTTALARIHAVRSTHAGTWDVCCQRSNAFVFVESKRRGRDRIRPEQTDWLEAALSLGLPTDAFLVVEWELDGQPEPADGSVQTAHPQPSLHRSTLPSVVPPVANHARMPGKDKLDRRTIRSGLQGGHGWTVKSHVEGTLSVWPPAESVSSVVFREQVEAAVRALGYEPTVISTRDEKGRTCIRFHTPETLKQAGRGGHGYRSD
jgi:hypothetical protein